jgi:hypothetical protein
MGMKIYRISQINIEDVPYHFYHGTSSLALQKGIPDEDGTLHSIKEEGLEYPYLASNSELAQYYAELMAENFGGEPIILEILRLNPDLLCYDRSSMDEPVMADEDARDDAWNLIAQEHPEWYDQKDDTVSIPIDSKDAWKYSYNSVGAVKYDGIIPFSDLKLITKNVML